MKKFTLAFIGSLLLVSACSSCSTGPNDVAPPASRTSLDRQDSPTANGMSQGTSNTLYGRP